MTVFTGLTTPEANAVRKAGKLAYHQAKQAKEVLDSLFPDAPITPEAVVTMTQVIAHNMSFPAKT
jgi:hypothetical protein